MSTEKKADRLARIEKLRIAGIIAPILRALNRPIRKIHLDSGKVTDSHQIALNLAKREGIEFDADRKVVGLGWIKTCEECGKQFVPARKTARLCSQKCVFKHSRRTNLDKVRANSLSYDAKNREKRRAAAAARYSKETRREV